MKETTKDRIERLTARKKEIFNKMGVLCDSFGSFNSEVRNARFKWECLNNEINRIAAKIMELREEEVNND